MNERSSLNGPSLTRLIGRFLLVILLLAPVSVLAQDAKPKVAILVYDGVQVIDHAIPFEVFGQFSLNDVYTVGKNPGPVTAYMGMQILPSYSFADAPVPDVLVLPGGDAGDAQKDPEITAWVERTAATADHILTVCTGIFFLVGNEILVGSKVTTWYDRQDDLQRAAPGAEVVGDQIVVESGKIVSSAGLGVEGALRVLARLHGSAWAEVVRLNMEYEPIPDSLRVPRVDLADLKLPGRIYSAFSWRQAELLRYEGDRDDWMMVWRFDQDEPLDSLRTRFLYALSTEEGWTLASENVVDSRWTSRWCVKKSNEENWSGVVKMDDLGSKVDLEMRIRKNGESCEKSADTRLN